MGDLQLCNSIDQCAFALNIALSSLLLRCAVAAVMPLVLVFAVPAAFCAGQRHQGVEMAAMIAPNDEEVPVAASTPCQCDLVPLLAHTTGVTGYAR